MGQLYNPKDWGKKEEAMMAKYYLQKEDAKNYFISCIKPRLDRSYKLYISYTGDRAKEIQKWQANVGIPYIQAVVETLVPRILDARPDFIVQGRSEDDQRRAPKLTQLLEYNWEIMGGDKTSEDITRSSLIYGTGFFQTYWKKDVRERKFLVSKDLLKNKLTWQEKEVVFYDAPYMEWIDNYSLWYDHHNISREAKQYWFKRLLLTGDEIKRRYPMFDNDRLEMAFNSGPGDLTDYASIRNEVKLVHEKITKGSDWTNAGNGLNSDRAISVADPDLAMHEVFEWLRPHDDEQAVMVNNVPILKKGSMPNFYDVKETNIIEVPYLRLPNEFEGMGLPMILESPQVMLSMLKNQRLDAATLNIQKMWIVNPLANIRKEDLVTRPFGIIYSPDPNGVKPVEFSDIKQSAYKEEELLKSDMRYASGVDDFSMGAGGGASSATEVRHLRESTLERVRLFVNHLGDAYSIAIRHIISMYRQFFTDQMVIRIVGEDGREVFPIIEKDDLRGEFDFKAMVVPSIAGMGDVEKKQNMDLFQLLIQLPFIDQQKLTGKVLRSFNWDLESVTSQAQQPQQMTPEMMMAGQSELPPGNMINSGGISPDIARQALSMLGSNNVSFYGEGMNPFNQLSQPVNLLQASGTPPTVPGLPTTNLRGANRKVGGKVNTNIPSKSGGNIMGALLNRTQNIQR